MNEKYDKIRIVLYVLVFLAALIYPVSKILTFECHTGDASVFDFRVAIRDPYDPFRGNYVTLYFEDNAQSLYAEQAKDKTNRFLQGQDVYVVIDKNKDGFAKVGSVTLTRESVPAGKSFLRLSSSNNRAELPFKKFFLNEKLAPEADRILRDSKITKFIRVRIYPNGSYAVEDLYVNGVPHREYIKTHVKAK